MLFPLRPNSTIGIIGGGQLGRMLAESAAKMGFRTLILEPKADSPAFQLSNQNIQAAYDDITALSELAKKCDVVTYEFENLSLESAQFLERLVPLFPPSVALEKAQDRLLEKQFLEEKGALVAAYHAISSVDDLMAALADCGDGILKTRRLGYDGKGQKIVLNHISTDEAQSSLSDIGRGPYIFEKLINFDLEFSLIATRSYAGDVVFFDPAINYHENGILRRSVVPGNIHHISKNNAQELANNILRSLNYVGTIGIEFFAIEDNIMVNEFSPRVHNSGHWTREACNVSQFDQHIRAIVGLALGDGRRHHDCEMVNLIGDEGKDVANYFEKPNSFVTLYGKTESRKGRKMGHVTYLI
ncbi:5-(carboxyamino)imidazole ribonucleotide synthase [Candidatus Endowatersipora endosymbiont of Watersipora subatra]|uniref:5-(carboxyamino)imidazole ribonucleotide synthase n=1 Tax=Candidatus Endowatersipora endosymbiont of Watersipora subatra TaxID=3077946 RepID=UPI00312CBB81